MLTKLKRVEQRDWEHNDCGIACVAMVCQKPYEEALAAFRSIQGKENVRNFGTLHHNIEDMLNTLKVTSRRFPFKGWEHIEGHAIVKVNKKKNGTWHWVVFDACRHAVHDPKPRKHDLVTDFRGLKGSGHYIQVINE